MFFFTPRRSLPSTLPPPSSTLLSNQSAFPIYNFNTILHILFPFTGSKTKQYSCEIGLYIKDIRLRSGQDSRNNVHDDAVRRN